LLDVELPFLFTGYLVYPALTHLGECVAVDLLKVALIKGGDGVVLVVSELMVVLHFHQGLLSIDSLESAFEVVLSSR